MKFKITKNTNIAEITEKYPEVGEVLVEDFGFHCIGCLGAQMETIGEGAAVHGMSGKEINEMVKTLNQLIEDIEANK